MIRWHPVQDYLGTALTAPVLSNKREETLLPLWVYSLEAVRAMEGKGSTTGRGIEEGVLRALE